MGKAAGQQYVVAAGGLGQQIGVWDLQHLLFVQHEALGAGQQRSSSNVFVAYLLEKVNFPEINGVLGDSPKLDKAELTKYQRDEYSNLQSAF